jgi:hypothetical protein
MISLLELLLPYLAYSRPAIRLPNCMQAWYRLFRLQRLVATVSAVGFGASIMIVAGFIPTSLQMLLIANSVPELFLLVTSMIEVMIINYDTAVIISISWLVFQTPVLCMVGSFFRRQR